MTWELSGRYQRLAEVGSSLTVTLLAILFAVGWELNIITGVISVIGGILFYIGMFFLFAEWNETEETATLTNSESE